MKGSLLLSDLDKLIAEIRKSGLFDEKAYLSDNVDVAASGIDPILHYLRHGLNEDQRRPYPEFDSRQYISDFSLEEIEDHPFLDLISRNCYRPETSKVLLTPQEIYLYNLILHYNLFDEDYYLKNNPDLENIDIPLLVHYVRYGMTELHRRPNRKYNNKIYIDMFKNDIAPGEIPFVHYLKNNRGLDFLDKGLLKNFSYETLSRATRRLEEFPLFSGKDYISLNGDVSSSELLPHQHAVLYGIPEGRTLLSKVRIAKILGQKSKDSLKYCPTPYRKENLSLPKSIGIFYHTDGNCFIKEIAEDLLDCLKGGDFQVSLETEKTPLSAKPDLCIFCAPHEFFFLEGSKHWEREDILKSSLMLNTEQSQTAWFTRCLIYLLMSAGVIDFLYQNIDLFESIGLPAFHFDPIPSAAATKILDRDRADAFFRVLPDRAKLNAPKSALRPISERALDVSFFGNASTKREKFFSRNADFFALRECFLYYRKPHGPIRIEGVNEILGRMPFYVAENSKICLNIHRNDDPYFEWHRIIKHGAARGSVVVTEECLPTPLYQEGIHFLAETPRHMPHLISWLLDTTDGQKKMQEIQISCLKLFKDKKLQKSKFNDIFNFIGRVWKESLENV
ncbi:hypothetical protein AAJCM20276_35530 (plasmid) [Acetobacter aceti]|uniref:Uncharacterized protein n=1 Tax=Acetobacter aceti TaxID=435 RepID=A0A6S6PN89_ACEAC|nr:hypothetical protein [Acetobacter aceti]BCI68929.1 hypothetical protein AAJCM20276_35530 [Acetobacter aceti]